MHRPESGIARVPRRYERHAVLRWVIRFTPLLGGCPHSVQCIWGDPAAIIEWKCAQCRSPTSRLRLLRPLELLHAELSHSQRRRAGAILEAFLARRSSRANTQGVRTMVMATYDVFLSYCHREAGVAKALVSSLQREGLSVWQDSSAISDFASITRGSETASLPPKSWSRCILSAI